MAVDLFQSADQELGQQLSSRTGMFPNTVEHGSSILAAALEDGWTARMLVDITGYVVDLASDNLPAIASAIVLRHISGGIGRAAARTGSRRGRHGGRLDRRSAAARQEQSRESAQGNYFFHRIKINIILLRGRKQQRLQTDF